MTRGSAPIDLPQSEAVDLLLRSLPVLTHAYVSCKLASNENELFRY